MKEGIRYEAFYLNKPKGIGFGQAETWDQDMPDLTISPELKEKLKIFEDGKGEI